MCVQFEGLGLCIVDGRAAMHLRSDDVARDVAELEYLLTRFEVIAEGHSVWLLEKAKAANRS